MKLDMQNFRPWGCNENPITCDGDFDLINWSDIRDKLIRLAAKYTDNYASDVLYGIEDIKDALAQNKISGAWYFGFRENGIDGQKYIECVKPDTIELYYRCVWKVELECDPARPRWKTLKMLRVSYHQTSLFKS